MAVTKAICHAMSRAVPTLKFVTKPTESAVPRGILSNEMKKEPWGQRGSNPDLLGGRPPP